MLGIDFAHPDRLWLLWGLLPMAAWSALGGRKRLREWEAFGQSGRPVGDGSVGWLVATAILVLALAQPRWGRTAGLEPPAGHDVVFCVDVSRSMGAEDAVPDRLGVAIASSLSLLRTIGEEPGHRAAVVAFASRGVVRCPLTSNLDAAADALRALRPGEVQPGGTDLGAALEVAADAFDPEEHAEGRTIVVFSDGEDHPGSWPRAIERFETAGIIVHGVAIGDPDRAHPVPRPDRPGPKADAGPTPETRRSDVALGAIAKATGGALVPIGLASADLGSLYRDRIAPMARRHREEIRPPERSERFPAFVLAALGVGLAGQWPGSARRRGGRLALAVPLLASVAIGAGPGPGSPGGLVASGRAAYDAGRFAEALDAFERAIALAPAAAIPRYDSAATLYQLGRYPEAIARYREAGERGDPGLATRIDYALGNTDLALGRFAEALAHYDACIASDWPGADLDAVRRDAAVNRAFAASRTPPPPDEPGGGAPTANRPERPRTPRGAEAGSPGDSAPSPAGAEPTASSREGGSPSSSSPRAGRPGESKEGQRPRESPEARLDSALREIREARQRRPAERTQAPPNGRWKDW